MSEEATDRDRAAAHALAGRLAEASGRRGGWREVRELLEYFEVDRLSQDAQRRISRALSEAGLTTEPPLEEVDRRGTVVLTSRQSAASSNGDLADDPSGIRLALNDVVRVREWDPYGALARPTLGDMSPDGRDLLRWFDLPDARTVRPAQILSALSPLCGGQLTDAMVSDLLSPDPRPAVKRYDVERDIRVVSAFGVRALESDEGVERGSRTKAGVIEFSPVEFLVGSNWLITCWQERDIYRGASRVAEKPPRPLSDLPTEVERCWRTGEFTTAGDLATLILHELGLGYAPACRTLDVWLEEWELDFYRRSEHVDKETLLEVRGAAAILRDWLSPMNPSGLRQDPAKAWFPGITGTQEHGGYKKSLDIDDRIDRSLAGLHGFGDRIRDSFDLLQLRQAEQQRDREENFQRTISIGGAVILVPTLVAGIAGSNTWVPYEHRVPGFLVMIVLMTALASVAWFWIRRMHRGNE